MCYTTRLVRGKVIFIMGATGTGKTKLSIALAKHLQSEVINSDKIQVYKGLDIVTNKVTESERQNIPHHLLSVVDPDADFTADDFCHHALLTIDHVIKKGRVPIIVGGSNSYIEALVEDPNIGFRTIYDCFFLWLDVSIPVLYRRVSERVDEMVVMGLVDEVREFCGKGADYSRGIRRAIGVPELDCYFGVESDDHKGDICDNDYLLHEGIENIKANTCKLVQSQLNKIRRMRDELGWELHRLDSTIVFEKNGNDAQETWEKVILGPSLSIVNKFLMDHDDGSLGHVYWSSLSRFCWSRTISFMSSLTYKMSSFTFSGSSAVEFKNVLLLLFVLILVLGSFCIVGPVNIIYKN